MNNKGFAITGVLYTIMILFLLILISILAALSSRNNLLKKSVESLETRLKGEIAEESILELAETPNDSGEYIAPVTGKYIFKTNSLGEPDCYSFIKKGFVMQDSTGTNNITFTTTSCNNFKNNGTTTFALEEIYVFETSNE